MISKEELIKFVGTRSWYQTIQFEEDVRSKGYDWCGEPAWRNIKTFLPESLEDMRVLDLGCNAGLFCVEMALLGAKEVIGVDYSGWRPNWDFAEQREFVTAYFEQKYNRKLPITYITGMMEDVLEKQDIGKFDYVLAIASIYYSTRQDSVVKRLYDIANKVIVRVRDDDRIAVVKKLFGKYNFKETKILQEKWWEKLHKQTDDFYLFLFEK